LKDALTKNNNFKVVKQINMLLLNNQNNTINKFESCFKTEISELNICNVGEHRIETTNNTPICQRNNRIQINFEHEISQEIEKNLRLGIIKESNSPWCSRIVPIKKKDGSLRLCIDYRALNAITIKDSYPIPKIDEILDSFKTAKIFSTLDATTAITKLP
jgi:hypothetical protein